jgi:hypothetical protein
MTRKQQLNNEISKIWDIYLIGKESFDYARYLYNPRTILEKQYLAKQRDLDFIRFILFRNSLIELSKLFHDRDTDKCNVHKFLKKFKRDQIYGDLFQDEVKISEWEDSIIKNGELIKKITTLRDKVYSHSDPNFSANSNFDLEFEDIERLFEIVKDIITTICEKTFDSFADLENIFFDKDRFNLIEILSKEWERKKNETIKYWR